MNEAAHEHAKAGVRSESSGRVPRLEGREKVSGAARFTSDITLPGQLYASVLRSPHAKARLRNLDISAASRIPGVAAILTVGDIPGVRWHKEELPTFSRDLRFVGDEIAAVAADSHEAVEDALRAITADYEVQEPVIGLERAASPDNLARSPETNSRGDIRVGFKAADVTVEATYTTPTALHNALEAHGCNAWWEGETLHLWESTQGIFQVRDQVAEKLGLPLNRVRVHADHVGGGFGAKQVAWKHSVIAALLARRTGRPVKLMLDRESENLASGNRNATRQHVKLGATADGRLCAISAVIHINTGACSVAGEDSIVAEVYHGLYACENVHTEQNTYYSNTGPKVAFRAPGFVEGHYALEQAMDELARKLDMDPFELRERNHTDRDPKSGKPYSSPDALRHCYRAARDAFKWERRDGQGGKSKRRGIGMAASYWLAGSSNPPAYAQVDVLPDGSVTVLTGTQDIGTGTRTALAQIAAEVLDLPPARINMLLGDTGGELRAPTSAGSATLPTVGPVVQAAARASRNKLMAAAAHELDVLPEDLCLQEGRIHDGAGNSISVRELARRATAGAFRGHSGVTSKQDAKQVCTFAAQCAEVEVDMDTGEITLLSVVCAPDCGRIVNPLLADSQVIGGVTQGLGYALTEQRITDPVSGLVLNANLEDYLVPTVRDVPPIHHARVNIPDRSESSLGAKGLGEPPMIATAPAIANAVFDATGIRIRELPITRKSLLEHLEKF